MSSGTTTVAVTSRGRGRGVDGTNRTLPKSKRRFVKDIMDIDLERDFGSKNSVVIARRRDVAILMRGGAGADEIQTTINRNIRHRNQQNRLVGLDVRDEHEVTKSTIKKDMLAVRRSWGRELYRNNSDVVAEIVAVMRANVQECERAKQEAETVLDRLKAIQTSDNVLRSLAKMLGVASDYRIEMHKTESKRVVVTGAPPGAEQVIEGELSDE